jgi:hypothetical protein
MRCLRIHGFVFCKYTISLPCLFKRWETMLFPQRLMQEWHQFRRSHGRNGSKGGFTVYEKGSPQKHQRHVHRSESVSSRKTPVNLVEILSLLRFHTTSDIHHNTIRSDLAWESSCVWCCRTNITCRSCNHTGKWMYQKESQQKHQRHVHRSESVSLRKTP